MPRAKGAQPAQDGSGSAKGAAGGCGSLVPTPADEVLTLDDTAESVMGRVQLACDDRTGVFFFRHKRKLYMRFIEVQ